MEVLESLPRVLTIREADEAIATRVVLALWLRCCVRGGILVDVVARRVCIENFRADNLTKWLEKGLELVTAEVFFREVLDKEVVKLLGEESCGGCRVSGNRRITSAFLRCLELPHGELEAQVLILLAVHSLDGLSRRFWLPILDVAEAA